MRPTKQEVFLERLRLSGHRFFRALDAWTNEVFLGEVLPVEIERWEDDGGDVPRGTK